MSFRTKVFSFVILAAAVPLVLATLISINMASNLAHQQNSQLLIAMRDNKKIQLERIAISIKDNVLAVAGVIVDGKFDLQTDSTHQLLTELNKELHFYDIFVISPNGVVEYTAAREADYQTNLINGPYRESGLAKMFQQAKAASGDVVATDFAPYAPSNNQPAAFIGVAKRFNGETWVIAAQISTEVINQLMQDRAGMGRTGETYLVGSDFRMRSDSYLDPQGHSINASFAGTIEKNGVTSDAVKEALAGKTDVKVVIDYNNNPVLSAYTPINFLGQSWVVLAEIDVAEIDEPINSLIIRSLLMLLVAFLVAFIVAFYVVRMVMRPLGGEPSEMRALMRRLAAGNLDIERSSAHPQSLRGALDQLSHSLREMLGQINDTATRLASTSEQLSVVTGQTDNNLSTQSIELDTIVTAVNEMAVTVREVSERSSGVAQEMQKVEVATKQGLTEIKHTQDITLNLANQVKQSHTNVNALAENITGITTMLDVIRGVAEQTNLLALNAAIEAARAGESGRGFAVVADEVRNLAHRTQESTQLIEKVIADVAAQTNTAVSQFTLSLNGVDEAKASLDAVAESIRAIVETTDVVSDQVVSVSAATEQQATVAASIDESLINLRDLGRQTAAGSHDTMSSSREVASVAQNLKQMVQKFMF